MSFPPQGSGGGGVTAHSLLTGLGAPADDHTQYGLLAGRAGGQVFVGGLNGSDPLTFRATASGTDGPIIFQSDPTTTRMVLLSTGQALFGGITSSTFGTVDLLEVRQDANAQRRMVMMNQNVGTLAKAVFFTRSNTVSLSITSTSSAFTPIDGLEASSNHVTSGVGKLILHTTSNVSILFKTGAADLLRFTILHGGADIQGNAGFTLQGGAGVHTLTLSGGASPASLISIGIASELIGVFGATPVVQPTGVAVTAAGIHAALVSLGWITA